MQVRNFPPVFLARLPTGEKNKQELNHYNYKTHTQPPFSVTVVYCKSLTYYYYLPVTTHYAPKDFHNSTLNSTHIYIIWPRC